MKRRILMILFLPLLFLVFFTFMFFAHNMMTQESNAFHQASTKVVPLQTKSIFSQSIPYAIGAIVPGFPPPGGLESFETQIGGRLDVVGWFQHWDHKIVSDQLLILCQQNNPRIPYITWEPWHGDGEGNPFPLTEIAAGQYDGFIRKSWLQIYQACPNKEILVRPMHEMNTKPGDAPWYPWQGDPETYIAAWRRIVGIAREVAPNTHWIWGLTKSSNNLQYAELYYPGDEWVNYIGVTMNQYWSSSNGRTWASFNESYSEVRPYLVQFGKPVFVAEVATGEGPKVDSKAQFVAELFEAQTQFPEVIGFVWLNNPSSKEDKNVIFLVDSSEVSLAAWGDHTKK